MLSRFWIAKKMIYLSFCCASESQLWRIMGDDFALKTIRLLNPPCFSKRPFGLHKAIGGVMGMGLPFLCRDVDGLRLRYSCAGMPARRGQCNGAIRIAIELDPDEYGGLVAMTGNQQAVGASNEYLVHAIPLRYCHFRHAGL